jgi:hypothetical protein
MSRPGRFYDRLWWRRHIGPVMRATALRLEFRRLARARVFTGRRRRKRGDADRRFLLAT